MYLHSWLHLCGLESHDFGGRPRLDGGGWGFCVARLNHRSLLSHSPLRSLPGSPIYCLDFLWTWTTPWSSIYLRSSLPSPSDSSLEFLSLLAPFAPWTLRSSDSLSCSGSGSRMVVVVVEGRGSGSGNGRGSSSGSGSVRVTVVVVVWGCWWCGVVGGGAVLLVVVWYSCWLHYITLHCITL